MKAVLTLLLLITLSTQSWAQSWQDVGGGTNNSSHGLLVWNGKLVDLGSFNNPCKRVATWNGSVWECLGDGVGIVARAGTIWNGNLVVVGDFWNVFQPCTNCNGIAMWDGTQWTNIGAGFNNDVLCVTVWNGDIVAAGDFTQSNGMPCSRIARWTGTTWEQIGPNNAFNNDIRAITEFEGELWVGGDFSNVGGCTSCDGLVKWDGSAWVGGNSGVDLSGGVDTTVRVLYTSPTDGRLYMGGHFRGLTPNGVYNPNLNGVAVYDGSDWFALGDGVGDNPDDYVRAISEYNGTIVVGGYFTSASGLSANKIARFDLTTQTWSAMGQGFDGVGVDEYVKSAAVWDGIMFAGGAYTQAEGGPMNYIAQWYEPPVAEPIAVINAEQSAICAGSCAAFTDNSTYSPTTWNWSFPGATITSSTAQNPPPICYNTAGTYTVTLEACNLNGCNTTTKTIVVNASASVAVNSPTVCTGSSTLLTANPSITGGSFLWSPGGETTSAITVSPSSNASYTVTYTSSGCGTATATSNVTVTTAPTVSVNNSTVCEGTAANLVATPSTGSGTYLWSPGGETTQTITVNPTGSTTYSVVYSLGNCDSSPATSTVTVNPAPQVTVSSTTICSGQTATLSATPTFGPGTYLWSPNGETTQSISISPSSTANYSVVYTSSGCSSPAVQGTVTVNPIPVVTVNNLTLCSGSSGTIAASPSLAGGNYLWSPGGETTPSISVSPSGNSSYSVSYTLNGCTSIPATSSVIVVTQPTVTSNSETICSGTSITLTASSSVGGGTYTWNPGGQTTSSISVNPTINSTYTVTYTLAGCPAASSTSAVTVNQTPSVTVNNETICEGDQAVLTASPSSTGGSYLWSPDGQTTQSITVAPIVNSNYGVTYTLNGCTSPVSTSVVTIQSAPDLNVNMNNNVLTAAQSGGTYQWLDCNNGNQPVSGETAQTFSPSVNGSYAVEVTLNGCSGISNCSVISSIGLSEESTDIVQISPNPTDDNIIISVGIENIGVTVDISDLNGKSVQSFIIKNASQTVDLSELSPGTYMIRINTQYPVTKRLIKL